MYAIHPYVYTQCTHTYALLAATVRYRSLRRSSCKTKALPHSSASKLYYALLLALPPQLKHSLIRSTNTLYFLYNFFRAFTTLLGAYWLGGYNLLRFIHIAVARNSSAQKTYYNSQNTQL